MIKEFILKKPYIHLIRLFLFPLLLFWHFTLQANPTLNDGTSDAEVSAQLGGSALLLINNECELKTL